MTHPTTQPSEAPLATIYAEAWKQYTHEDNLGQARSALFLSVETALIGIVGFALKPLLDLGSFRFDNQCIDLRGVIVGGLLLIVGIVGFTVSRVWQGVVDAGQRYLNLRWFPIIAIEHEWQLESISIARLEHRWRSWKQQQPHDRFYPFRNDMGQRVPASELAQLYLEPLPQIRGWSAQRRLAIVFKFVALGLLTAGVALLVLSAFYTRLAACPLATT